MTKLEHLLSIGSRPICNFVDNAMCLRSHNVPVFEQITAMLKKKNGFIVFESALIIRPSISTVTLDGLDAWNNLNGWRRWYAGCLDNDAICFAEDLFGGQFAASVHGIFRFDPESGESSLYANSIEEWAHRILENYAEDTGWPLAHDWQIANGPLLPEQRLLPKKPFIIGGDYVVENMIAVETRLAMEKWGHLFKSIQMLPDGTEVTLTNWIH